MSIVSIGRHIIYKTKIEYKIGIFLAAGAFLGGYIGNFLFSRLLKTVAHANSVIFVQNAILVLLLICVLIYTNKFREKATFRLKNPLIIIVTGICLGTASSFLGIGGGPINIVALSLLFAMEPKQAAVNSILLIFFSQASKLITTALSGGFVGQDLTMLWLMIPAGILGGFIGSTLNKKLKVAQMTTVFNATTVVIIAVGIINSLKCLFPL